MHDDNKNDFEIDNVIKFTKKGNNSKIIIRRVTVLMKCFVQR